MAMGAAPGSAGTILIVDDDEALVGLLQRMVERDGFDTVTASTAEEAIAAYRRQETAIDLVITDLVMAGTDGRTLVHEILRLDPTARILVSTGYYDDRDISDLLEAGAKGIVLKPYNSTQLLERVHAALLAA